jgi:outer membrane protein assembly factor BamE
MPTTRSHLTLIMALLLATLLLAGCNDFIYKTDVSQGNILRSKDIELLEEGLTKSQVISLIGTPAVADPFHQQRWDYISTYSTRGEDLTVRHMILTFDESDRLLTMEGDYLDDLLVASRQVKAIDEGEDEAPIRTDENALPQPNLPEPPSSNDGNQL